MNLSKKLLATATTSALLTLSAGLAFGQEQDTEVLENDKSNGLRLEEVVVSATYRDTSLMDTAGAISALTEDFMRNQGAEDMADLFQLVPGLNMATEAGGNNRFVVRGISSQTGESQLSITASAIGVYLDNVPVSSAVGPAVQMSSTIFDVQRVEVLKGPQGTLFGEGSQGGTIRYLFNKADPTAFDASLTVGGQMIDESDDYGHRIDGMVNFPITENFAIRAMGFDTSRPGWIDNVSPEEEDFNDSESRGGRLSFNWQASDRFALEGSYYDTKQTVNGASRSDFGTPYVQTSGRTPGRPPKSTDDFELYNLVANVDLGFATLTASTAYSEREMLFFHEYNGFLTTLIDFVWFLNEQDAGWPGNNPFIDPNLNSITNRNRLISEQQVHELRLVSNDEGSLRWTAGVFYKDSDDLYDFDLEVSGLPGKEFVEPIAVDILTPEDPDALNGLDNMKQWAVYGEVSYDFNPQWTLTVGGRYADLQQELGNQPELGAEDNPFTPKVELSWRPNDDLLLYATYAEGFRQGNTNRLFGATAEQDLINDIANKQAQEGISEEERAADLADLNGRLDVTRSERAFDGDTLKNYELGLKTTLFDGRAELRTAAYYIEWTDLIQSFRIPA
ncbi:hypothetical protein NOR51B_2748 [Luminiphilus syltensis NOR5-1B]|uniref:TonB-dependent receptor n=1 Tax=Luminiphilus syltensis NOR5-1B TaxID=565045 RepID=B8KW85_9GAMM|nr:TonB-dependent receptor [Luminiphilus syltensis]EED36795.1 hypothetical protein NOR51B_2748 [Luminiphilus syltensis NOR5-1B]